MSAFKRLFRSAQTSVNPGFASTHRVKKLDPTSSQSIFVVAQSFLRNIIMQIAVLRAAGLFRAAILGQVDKQHAHDRFDRIVWSITPLVAPLLAQRLLVGMY